MQVLVIESGSGARAVCIFTIKLICQPLQHTKPVSFITQSSVCNSRFWLSLSIKLKRHFLVNLLYTHTMVRALHLHLSCWLHIVDICCTPNSPILWLWFYCRQLANLLSGYRVNIPCFMEWDDWLARLMERLLGKPVTIPRALSVDPCHCSDLLLSSAPYSPNHH